MSGPCSLPSGGRRDWQEMNEIVCDIHFKCDMQEVDAKGRIITHDYITYREWLYRRNRLVTGKSR